MLLRCSVYKHFTQTRISSWQKQLVRFARDRSVDDWIDIVREAQALYGDVDKDKDIYTAWNGDCLVSMNKLQYDSALKCGLVDSYHPETHGVLTDFDSVLSQKYDWALAESMKNYRVSLENSELL